MTGSLKKAIVVSCLFVSVGRRVPANDMNGTVRDLCGPVLAGASVLAANGSGVTARAIADEKGDEIFARTHTRTSSWHPTSGKSLIWLLKS